MIEYAEEMSKTNVQIPDELFAQLREHFNDEQLVELTAAIAIENFRARFNNALDIPPAGFSEGAYCPMPERSLEAVSSGDGARVGGVDRGGEDGLAGPALGDARAVPPRPRRRIGRSRTPPGPSR